MNVLGNTPHLYYLLERDNVFYLDILCWRGPYAMEGFSTLIQLSESEQSSYNKSDTVYLDNLAQEIQQNPESVARRDIKESEIKSSVSSAIQKWLGEQSGK